MNLAGLHPLPKQPKAAKDPAYLERVRDLRCCVCEAFGEMQTSPTMAHHPIHDEQIMVVSGHRSRDMVEKYAGIARQIMHAKAAIAKRGA